MSAQKTITAKEALALLKEGNKRYTDGSSQHPHQNADRRKELTEGQAPFAVILSCADSRVPPEVVFDQGLGDLFVLRVAGNIADDHVIGSIEYAIAQLGTQLIVVMGHEKCGAVGASLGKYENQDHIKSIVDTIKPAVYAAKGQPGDLLTNAVHMNARIVAESLKEKAPVLSEAVASDKLEILPAYYALESGEVSFL